jgi:hypothetical protein
LEIRRLTLLHTVCALVIESVARLRYQRSRSGSAFVRPDRLPLTDVRVEGSIEARMVALRSARSSGLASKQSSLMEDRQTLSVDAALHANQTSEYAASLRLPDVAFVPHPSRHHETYLECSWPIPALAAHILLHAPPAVKGHFRDLWSQRHHVCLHVLLPAIGHVPKKYYPSVCQLAGRCLHTSPILAAFECALIVQLTRLFPAKSFAR